MPRALLLLFLLAACASQTPAPLSPGVQAVAVARPIDPLYPLPALRPGRPDRPCALAVIARLHLVEAEGGALLTPAMINGRQVLMQVDTGAETSVLTPQGAAWLNLAPGPARSRVMGVGGTAGYGSARIDSLGFGDQSLHGLDLPIMQLGVAGRPGEAPSPAGLIGSDLLAPYQAEFDFHARRLTLYRANGCGRVRPGWTGPFATLNWRSTHDLAFVGARLDGNMLTALIDTGSDRSTVTQQGSLLNDAAIGHDPGVQSVGAGNRPMPGRSHRFGFLDVGGITVAHPVLRITALNPAIDVDMLIGLDLLGDLRLWMDYPGRRSFLQSAAGA